MKLPDPTKPFDQQEELVLLAMQGWGEARGEPDNGLAAVQHVVLTRCAMKHTTVAQEVLRPWAFSAFNAKDPNRFKLLQPLKFGSLKDWERAVSLAESCLHGSPNPMPEATHYIVDKFWLSPVGKRPQWYDLNEIASGRTKKLGVIGRHVFARAAF